MGRVLDELLDLVWFWKVGVLVVFPKLLIERIVTHEVLSDLSNAPLVGGGDGGVLEKGRHAVMLTQLSV